MLPDRLVKAILTCPRLTFTDQVMCVLRGILPLGINIGYATGVYWGQCMSRLFDAALAEGYRYILTLDYDSLFSQDDVLALVRTMEARPDIGALCGVQMHRGEPLPLFSIADRAGIPRQRVSVEEIKGEPLTRLATGHFGLTLLRCEALGRLPPPRFWGEPDPGNPHWADGRTDDDVMFWRRWEGAGNTLYQANDVVIGHLQLVAIWPDQQMRPTYQPVARYLAEGKPSGVWRRDNG